MKIFTKRTVGSYANAMLFGTVNVKVGKNLTVSKLNLLMAYLNMNW